jgi:ubiquinol-cytochrome c reductase iron-sulfur subunit
MSHSTEISPTSGEGELIPDPGIPPHEHRLTDTDPKAAKRAERQVAGMFGIATIASFAAVVAYVLLPLDGSLSRLQASNLAIGLSLGLAIFLIGAAAIHWAKKLMPDVEVVQERHELSPTPEAQAEAIAAFNAGVEESGFGRRTLIRNSMIGAFLALPLPALVLLGDLGPLQGAPQKKASTIWAKGVRVLNDVTFTPIRPDDVRLGAIINAMPETYKDIPESEHAEALVQRGKSSVIVVRMSPADMDEATAAAAVDGIACYSKICTHVGCPLSLWERTTNNMLCPCHQSTFNLAQGGRVIFGPARRPLPQLALEVDAEGYLAAQGDFADPVGPSFWERERV